MRTPTNTYRLQITSDFTLYDAATRLDYLRDLGVDWVYLSPILQATQGSEHGYDVTDHSRVDESRGGADGLAALSAEARRLGMGVLVDIVPNHMGVAVPHENAAWWDLLKHGQDSAYAAWFDVDWAAGDGRIRIPVVGDDDLLDDGTVAHLQVQDGELCYHDNRYPIAPGTGDGTPQEVHARQHYDLAGWRRADHDLNYRRFFGINTLAAVRVEDRSVFEQTHAEIGRWFDEGLVDGLRIDHPDGLRDPGGYLQMLRERTGGAFIVVEKILEPGEELERWECEGTTGYDSLGAIDRVLTDPAGQSALTDLDTRLRGEPLDWHDLIHATKRAITDHTLGSEVHRTAREMALHTGDPAASDVDDAIAELLACFPVYRSYLPAGREHLEQAARTAREHRPDLSATIDLLMPILSDPQNPAAQRFQQTSGMVMAKGVEDTAFYRYARLTSLNEVGGDPSVFALSVPEFHDQMRRRQHEWPHAMNAMSTHDTKRSEDVRARIALLAQAPERWNEVVSGLQDRLPAGDPAYGNLVMQAVLGTWPSDRDRLREYAVKGAREAATVTTWTANDEAFETSLADLVDAAMSNADIARLADDLDKAWRSNVLAAKLLNLTIPGFPDVYQGTERIDDSLVDPDNRRPVAWPADAAATESPFAALSAEKTTVVREVLRIRRDRPELFATYEPIDATGALADHVLAFDRGGAITVVTRLALGIDDWNDTEIAIPEGNWRDVLTGVIHRGGPLRVSELFADLPVALLARGDEP